MELSGAAARRLGRCEEAASTGYKEEKRKREEEEGRVLDSRLRHFHFFIEWGF